MAPWITGRTDVDTEAGTDLALLSGDTSGAENEFGFPHRTMWSAELSRIGSPAAFASRADWTRHDLMVVDSGDTMRITIRMPGGQSAIETTPSVCGGAARVRGTRIPVWTLERFRQLGTTVRDLLDYYPSLTRARLGAALTYARRHQDEIAAAILRNEAPAD